MQPEPMTLRERQRLEVTAAIHDAAAELLLDNGWTATTTDMIAAKAGISSRTFFNHFATKEDAALGLRQLHVPVEARTAFLASDADLLERVVLLTMSVLRTVTPDDGLNDRRAVLLRTVPELRTRVKYFSVTAGELIEPILVEELEQNQPLNTLLDYDDVRDAAAALRMLAGTIIRFAFTQHQDAFSVTPDSTLWTAIETFRKVIKTS